MKESTVAVPFVRQSLAGLKAAGLDAQPVLRDSGIPPGLLSQPRARVPAEAFIRLHQRLIRVLDDEAIGLLSIRQPIGSFELVARAALHATTLGEAMEQTSMSNNLLRHAHQHEVEHGGDQIVYRIRLTPDSQALNAYASIVLSMSVHRFLCWLTKARVPLAAVDLDHAAPAWADQYRALYFDATMRFGAQHLALYLPTSASALTVKRDIHSLRAYLDRAPRDMFFPRGDQTLSQQVRELILHKISLSAGVPEMVDAARHLDLHPQTLRRRLTAEYTSYTDIRTQARRDMAVRLLKRTDASVEDIALSLGFSESSAFVRAFGGWMGMTPAAYRRA